MQDIQEVFVRIRENKKKQKEIRDMYKDMLLNTSGYEELVEEAKVAREKKKAVETQVKEQMSSELIMLDDLKIEIETDQELLSDIAMSMIMKGQTVQVTDEYDNEFEPQFKVNFKKVT
jgi:hypothetical protein